MEGWAEWFIITLSPLSHFSPSPAPTPRSGLPSPSRAQALPGFPGCGAEGSSWAVGLGVGNRLEIQWEGYSLDSKKNFLPFQGGRVHIFLFTRKSRLEHPGSGKGRGVGRGW